MVFTVSVLENQKNLPEVSKGPISFSIKTKVPKKPKIEYRTSVIYKQSLEQEESDEEGAAEVSGAERQGKDEGNGKQPEENTSNEEKQQAEDEMAGDSLSQQMDSIKAAERIGMNTFESVVLAVYDTSCFFFFINIVHVVYNFFFLPWYADVRAHL